MNAEQAGEQLVDTFEKNLAWLMNIYNQTTISLTLEELKSFVKNTLRELSILPKSIVLWMGTFILPLCLFYLSWMFIVTNAKNTLNY